MRDKAYALVLSTLVVQAACGDDGSDETTTPMVTMPSTMTSLTQTQPLTDTGAEAEASATEPTSNGSVSNSASETGPEPSTGPEPTTGIMTNPLTSTDPTDTSTGPSTMSDPGTSSTTDPSTSSTDPSGTSSTTSDDTTTAAAESTSTTSDDTTSAAETEDVPCSVIEATLTPIAPNMMLVLDKSGSMLTKWDHDANANTATITRWQSLHETVSTILNKYDQTINFGANLFPSKSATNNYDATACPVQGNVEVKVMPDNGTAILNAIPAAANMTIKGGTPASAGMTAALTHLKTLDPAIPRAVLFITDGAANCGAGLQPPPLFEQYDMMLHTIVDNAFAVDKIPTYVIGIDIANALTPNTNDGNPNGINPYEKLNDVAVKGGKPKGDPNEKFYQANNQIELTAALDAIISDAISCVIPLSEEPAKPEFTEVEIMGVEVPKVNDCANQSGWVFTNPNGPYNEIKLCGQSCTDLKKAGKADVNFFCSPG